MVAYYCWCRLVAVAALINDTNCHLSQMASCVPFMQAAKTGEFAQACLSLRHNTKILVMAICVPFKRAAKAGEFAHDCLSLRHSTKSLCWLKRRFVCDSCEQRRLVSLHRFAWAFLTVPKACAGSNGDLCAIHANSEGWWVSTGLLEPSSQYQKLVLAQMAIFVPFMRAAKTVEFAQVCLSLRHSTKACVGSNSNLCAAKTGESVYLHCLAWAFVRVTNSHVMAQIANCQPFMRVVKTGESEHLHRLAWAFATVPKSNVLAQLAFCVSLMRAAKTGEYTFSQACLSLRHSTKFSCAAAILCAIHASSEDRWVCIFA